MFDQHLKLLYKLTYPLKRVVWKTTRPRIMTYWVSKSNKNHSQRVVPKISRPITTAAIHLEQTRQLKSKLKFAEPSQQVAPEAPTPTTTPLTEIEQASQTCLDDLQAANVLRNGSVLQVCFMNDDEWGHGRHEVSYLVQSYWERYANIKFDFLYEGDNAPIRIKFGLSDSYLRGVGSRYLNHKDTAIETMGLEIHPKDLTWCSKDDPNVRQPILHEVSLGLET